MKNHHCFICLCLLLTAVLLTGCGRMTAAADPSLPSEQTPVPIATPESAPAPTPSYDLSFTVGGQAISPGTQSLDLTKASSAEIDRLISVLPALTSLNSLELGQAQAEAPLISWEQVYALRQGLPRAAIHYAFTVQGYPFTLDDEILNLNHLVFSDEGALAEKIAACMPNLKILDMDSCGVSNESMAAIRDHFPGVDVVWRVKVGIDYSLRTNETRLVVSNPDRGGDLNTPEAIEGLYYCTKAKYLDLGHNYKMTDISFVRNMPDLEVLILAMTAVKDISALESCPKLNYLEYQSSAACDLRPLSKLTELKDLNICYDLALHDIRPIYDLDLDRLYIGCFSPIPKEQIAEFQKRHPNCQINTTTDDPTNEGWRMDVNEEGVWDNVPRYALLRQQFQYDNFPGCYAYTANDYRVYGRFEY